MSTSRPSPFARVARWCITHRWQTLGLWLLGIVLAFVLGGAVGLKQMSGFRLPGTESQHAYDVLAAHSPEDNGTTDQLVFRARGGGTLKDPAIRRRVDDALQRVASEKDLVAAVDSPFGPKGQLTQDGRTGVASVTYTGDVEDLDTKDLERVQQAAFAARSPSLQVEHGGLGAEALRFQDEGGGSEYAGLIIALIVLIMTFGSVVAAGVPLITAIFAVGTTMGLVPVISHLVDTPDFASQLAGLIGLGVGIDYALIVLTRYRAEVAGGQERQEAIVKAIDTAGRTVFFAGCTVIIALLGLMLLGLSFLHGPALASALVVALAMLSALTLLPMLLSRFGGWIDRLHLGPKRPVRAGGGRWGGWSDRVQRRPWVAIVVSLVVLAGLAVPALHLRLGTADAGLDPEGSTTRQAYDLIADGFGAGVSGPFVLVAELPRKGDAAAGERVAAAVRADPGVAQVLPPQVSEDGAIATVTLFPRTGPREAATADLLDRLRDQRLPAVERATGARVSVGGETASQEDFTAKIASKLPLFVGVVVLLSALLLLVVFRSVVIPVKAALMNLLSIGAALGFVTLVFQDGAGAGLLGAGEGPIESFLPVMMFAIVFGLSMDYEVFLISRMHEEWARTGDASGAVRSGLASTGRVITAAAAIMVVVFAGFLLGGDRVIKEFGLGLSIAVLLDAVVIRCLLVPALMHLLGARAWWVPRGLDRRLPHISIEAPSTDPRRSAPAASGARP